MTHFAVASNDETPPDDGKVRVNVGEWAEKFRERDDIINLNMERFEAIMHRYLDSNLTFAKFTENPEFFEQSMGTWNAFDRAEAESCLRTITEESGRILNEMVAHEQTDGETPTPRFNEPTGGRWNPERVGDERLLGQWTGDAQLLARFQYRLSVDEDLRQHADLTIKGYQMELPGMYSELKWAQRYLYGWDRDSMLPLLTPAEALLKQYADSETKDPELLKQYYEAADVQRSSATGYFTRWKSYDNMENHTLGEIFHPHSTYNEEVLHRLIEKDYFKDSALQQNINGESRKDGKSFQQQVADYSKVLGEKHELRAQGLLGAGEPVQPLTEPYNQREHPKGRFRGLYKLTNDAAIESRAGVSGIGGGILSMSFGVQQAESPRREGESRRMHKVRVDEEQHAIKTDGADYNDRLARIPWDDRPGKMGKRNAVEKIQKLFHSRLDYADQDNLEGTYRNTARGRALEKKHAIRKVQHAARNGFFDKPFVDATRANEFRTTRRGEAINTLASRRENKMFMDFNAATYLAGSVGQTAHIDVSTGARQIASAAPPMSTHGSARAIPSASRSSSQSIVKYFSIQQTIFELRRKFAHDYINAALLNDGQKPMIPNDMGGNTLYDLAMEHVTANFEMPNAWKYTQGKASIEQRTWAYQMKADLENSTKYHVTGKDLDGLFQKHELALPKGKTNHELGAMVRITDYTTGNKKVGVIQKIEDHSRDYADQKFPNWVSPRGQRFVQAVTQKVEELMQQIRDRALQKKREEEIAALSASTKQEAEAKLQATITQAQSRQDYDKKRAHDEIEEVAGTTADAVTPEQSVEYYLKNIAGVETTLRPHPDHDVTMVDTQIRAIATNLSKLGQERTRAQIANMFLDHIRNGKMTYAKFVKTETTCASSPLESVEYYLKNVSGDKSVSPQVDFNSTKVEALIGNFETKLKDAGKDVDRKAVARMLLAQKQLFSQLI